MKTFRAGLAAIVAIFACTLALQAKEKGPAEPAVGSTPAILQRIIELEDPPNYF